MSETTGSQPRESGADKILDGLNHWAVFDRMGLPCVEVCDYIHAVNIIRALQSLLTTTQRELEEARDRCKELEGQASLLERTAQISAHRGCCGTEHDPANGKIHGYCVVCGIPWPCEYSGKPPTPAPPAKEGEAGECRHGVSLEFNCNACSDAKARQGVG